MLLDKSNLTSRLAIKGNMLVAFLNAAPGPPKQRVLALRERCRELAKLFAEARCKSVRWPDGGGVDQYRLGSDQRSEQLLKEINQRLAKYRFRRVVPSVAWAEPGEAPGFPTSVESGGPKFRVPQLGFSFTKASLVQYSRALNEGSAVELLLGLAEVGGLDRVLECPQCKQWFVARRKNQEYCRPAHGREKYYEDHKEQWPKYMRRSRLKGKMVERNDDLQNRGFAPVSSNEETWSFQNKRTGERAVIDCRTAQITYLKAKGKRHAK